ncbi:GGDEF domain-containing protein [Hippea maritima]|uniref:diguanylate cyclase n=1 Tax=Hippea maritima (strain ATCC 700847 / DSM 10411 / MH2) TaxID=760142 RepID=F2LTQ2_HIPMA|nr:GGDEF domain-containing protein [Hippea maritima]AEA34428.1 diguanylate cyclase [Hippea maritima DSM 10411]
MNRKNLFSNSIVKENAFYMILMGMVVGLIFIPLSIYILNLPENKILSVSFLVATILSGILVGLVSFFIVKLTILKKLEEFKNNIEIITKNIFNYQVGKVQSISECTNCYIKISSQDIVGDLAIKYNALVRIIRGQFWQHELVEKFSSLLNKITTTAELNQKTSVFFSEELELLGCEIYRLSNDGSLVLECSRNIHTTITQNKQNSMLDIIDGSKIISIKKDEAEVVEFGTGNIKTAQVTYFPLKYAKHTWLFVFYSNYYLSKERKILIERILNEYKFAYESAEMYEKTQQMAAYDELTGLYNRRFGMIRLKEEYKRSLRTEQCLCLIMFDVDHFKKINDTYGHQAGDYILSSVSKILKSNFRTEDVVLRYGGEEFLCAMSNSDKENAVKKAEEIRKIIQETQFKWRDVPIKITISAGVSRIDIKNGEQKSIEQLIKEADEALYIAKRSGRNKIVTFNPHCKT